MSARDASASAPPSWAATQQWLDDLDQDAPAPAPAATTVGPPSPTTTANRPISMSSTPTTTPHPSPSSTMPTNSPPSRSGDASEQATVRLDNAFGRDYTPADPGSDDAHRGPDPQPYFDDTDDADLYDTEPTDLDVMAPDVLDAHHNPADSAPPADEPADPPRFNKAVAVGFIAATVVATIGVTATLLAMRSSPQPEPEQASPTTQISVAARPGTAAAHRRRRRHPDPLHRLSPRLPARIQCRPGSGRHRPHPSLGMRAQRR